MVPHPQRQWCFSNELGTHWYAAPVEAYAPSYRFIRENAAWFDGYEAVESQNPAPNVPANVLVTVRKKSGSNQVVLHLLNRDYDPAVKRFKVLSNVEVAMDNALVSPTPVSTGASLPLRKQGSYARLLSYDKPPQQVDLTQQGGALRLRIPELRLWTLAILE
jgi:hypothetical protein